MFVLWLCLLGRLTTKDRLQKFGVSSDGLCVFCGISESAEHLYFACPITQHVWRSVLGWIGYSHNPKSWPEEVLWLVQECRKKNWQAKLLKAAIAEVVYGIWRTRNYMVFNGARYNAQLPVEIIHIITVRCQKDKKLLPFIPSY